MIDFCIMFNNTFKQNTKSLPFGYLTALFVTNIQYIQESAALKQFSM